MDAVQRAIDLCLRRIVREENDRAWRDLLNGAGLLPEEGRGGVVADDAAFDAELEAHLDEYADLYGAWAKGERRHPEGGTA